MPVNWCEEWGTHLDEVIDGKSERGGFPVTVKYETMDIPDAE